MIIAEIILPTAKAAEAADEAVDEDAELDEQGFQASFSQLAAAGSIRDASSPNTVAWAGSDLWAYLLRQLAGMNARRPGTLHPLLQRMPSEAQLQLNEALQKGGIIIA